MQRCKTEFHEFRELTLPDFCHSPLKVAIITKKFTGKHVKLLGISLKRVIIGN